MAGYIILAQARRHLRTIRAYTVENWGRDQAKVYLDGIDAAFDLLARNPGIRADRGEDLKPGVMSFLYESHVIYYRKTPKRVVIVAVLHQSMIPRNHLLI